MALLKLKRNWFGPDGVRYRARDGLHQVSDEVAAQAPSDAEVFDDNGKSLPSRAPLPLPGFGAKPLHEQVLDLIPGAAPMHVQKIATSDAPTLALDETEQKKVAETIAEREKLTAEQAKDPDHGDDQAKIDSGLAVAEKVEEKIAEATDPVETGAKLGAGTGGTAAPATPAKPATPPATTPAKK